MLNLLTLLLLTTIPTTAQATAQATSQLSKLTHTITLEPYKNFTIVTNHQECLQISYSSTEPVIYELTLFTDSVFRILTISFSQDFTNLEDAPYVSYFINANTVDTTIRYIIADCTTSSSPIGVLFIVLSLLIPCICIISYFKHRLDPNSCIPVISSRIISKTRLLYYQSLSSQSSQSQLKSYHTLAQTHQSHPPPNSFHNPSPHPSPHPSQHPSQHSSPK